MASAPRVCVLRAPGTNCDVETAFAFERCGGRPRRVHILELGEKPALLREFQVLCIPGGFSYGDDVGAGVVFGDKLRGRLREAMGRFLEADTLTLGICNGFQVLLKSGVLPGGATHWDSAGRERDVTLTWNSNGQYTALWVTLDVQSEHNVFLRGLDRLELPIAHAEGRIALRGDAAAADGLTQGAEVALKYADPAHQSGWAQRGTGPLPYPLNPNGSAGDIAGLGDAGGRILGLMPHPERYLFRTQHPQWTRRGQDEPPCGLKIFENAMEYFQSS